MRNEWIKLHFSCIHSSPGLRPHEQFIFVYLMKKNKIEEAKLFKQKFSMYNFPLFFIDLFVFIEVAGINWFIRL